MGELRRAAAEVALTRTAHTATTILTGILVARLLTPEDYGTMILVFSLTGILAWLGDLGLLSAATRFGALDIKRARNYATTATVARFVVTVVLLILFVLFAPLISNIYNQDLNLFIILSALSYLLLTPAALTSSLAARGEYRRLSALYLILAFLYPIIFFIFVYNQRLLGAFIASTIYATFSGLLSIWFSCLGKWNKKLLNRMLPFGLLTLSTTVIAYVLQNYDKVLVGLYVNTSQLAFYSLAQRAALFLVLTTLTLKPVIMPNLAKMLKDRTGKTKELYRKTVIYFLAFSIIASVVIYILFKLLLTTLLTKYAAALVYLPLLLLAFTLEATFGTPANFLLTAANRVDQILKVNLLQLALGLALALTLIPAYGAWGAVYATVGVYSVSTLFYLILSRRIIKSSQ